MIARRDDGRLRGWRAGLVWAVLGLDLAAVLGAWLAAGAGPDTPAFVPLLFASMVASLGGVGALVATRKPRDPVGWILLASASTIAFSVLGQDYVRLSVTDFGGTLPLTVAVAWLYGLAFIPSLILIAGVMPLYFPDGRLPSRRWRWVVWLAALGIAVVSLPPAFDPGPLPNTTFDNPLGITGFHDYDGILGLSNAVIFLAVLPLAIASSVLKYRRGGATIRQQLKWFAAVALFTFTSFAAALTGIAPISALGWLLGLLGLILLPIAIGIAILRYRLYDIDRIISRTVSYGVVTGILAIVFVGTILVSQTLLSGFFSGSSVAVAASTLVVAALFQPLRRRVQGIVDRRFNRSRYDAERTVTAFGASLREEVNLGALRRDLVATIDKTLQPTATGVWLLDRAGGDE
jgi:MFS family permease